MQWLPTREDVANWRRIPCLRESLMRGIGGGVVLGLALGAIRGHVRAVGDGLLLGGAAVASVNWVLCRHNDSVRRSALHRAMLAQTRAPDQQAIGAFDARVAPSSHALAAVEGARAAKAAEEASYTPQSERREAPK